MRYRIFHIEFATKTCQLFLILTFLLLYGINRYNVANSQFFLEKGVALDNLNSGGCISSPISQVNSWKMPNIISTVKIQQFPSVIEYLPA